MQNLSEEQKQTIERAHYAVKNDTPIRYEELILLDPHLSPKIVDTMNEMENDEKKYESMYDAEI